LKCNHGGHISSSPCYFPPRFINPWIGSEFSTVFHLVYRTYPNKKHRLHEWFNIQMWMDVWITFGSNMVYNQR
jgi:hypothetical protein